jgi:hypothetical protein
VGDLLVNVVAVSSKLLWFLPVLNSVQQVMAPGGFLKGSVAYDLFCEVSKYSQQVNQPLEAHSLLLRNLRHKKIIQIGSSRWNSI